MAYSLENRFLNQPKQYTILDPGAYQNAIFRKIPKNKVGFNSRSERKTQSSNKIWTHTIYESEVPRKIPNCTSLMSKVARFPYDAWGPEVLKEFLCRCGIEDACDCESDVREASSKTVCQSTVRKTIIIGIPPRVAVGAESLRDINIRKQYDPPFYDTRVKESTAFYRGCKWSRWASKRNLEKKYELGPGPAAYTIQRQRTKAEICADENRSQRRRYSKQTRFLEMLQRREILENRPGPAAYRPQAPKGIELEYLGPKAERFPQQKRVQRPGPADYSLKRDFDLPEPPLTFSSAPLSKPPFFGVKAIRFKRLKEWGPSPASYSVKVPTNCNFNCSDAPFGKSASRWEKSNIVDDSVSRVDVKVSIGNDEEKLCPNVCWMFKSETVRMKPFLKKKNEPSPADLPQQSQIITRDPYLQYIAPFNASEGRFLPWHNDMPVFGQNQTPDPGVFCQERPRCPPAVRRGPLSRSNRFHQVVNNTPAPNEYTITNGMEAILNTHSVRLKKNIDGKHKFQWKPPVDQVTMTLEEKESVLLNKSIKLLDSEDFFSGNSTGARPWMVNRKIPTKIPTNLNNRYNLPKLLRCFLYNKKMPNM